jgi:hypothetical protein
VRGGRGDTPKSADEQLRSVLVRISIPGEDQHGGPKPHPNYGDQIQNQGLMGQDRDATYLGERAGGQPVHRLGEFAFADGSGLRCAPRLRIKTSISARWVRVMIIREDCTADFRPGTARGRGRGRYPGDRQRRDRRACAAAQLYRDAIGSGSSGASAEVKSAVLRQQVAAAFHGDLG